MAIVSDSKCFEFDSETLKPDFSQSGIFNTIKIKSNFNFLSSHITNIVFPCPPSYPIVSVDKHNSSLEKFALVKVENGSI